jgi:tRNA U34 2-thiouridine synthase MnmA/TrmU
MNPCIDCKINMLKAAKERMKEAGASFVVTGEVLGERPMSQRKDMLALIEKQSGLKGLLLRPLTAKLLEPTLPEKEGMVDREKLLDIRGRSRRPQIALAEKLGITEYPNPAGGCLLTDPGFARRIRDIMKHNAFNMDNLELLTVGRHFRLSDKAKLVVGRDENENALLEKMIKGGDICFRLMDGAGPVSILRGEADRALVESAAAIVAHHTKFKKENTVRMGCWKADAADHTVISVMPAAPEDVERIRL